MPPRRDGRAERQATVDGLARFAWTDEQRRVFSRAELLRRYRAEQAAADLVARECPLPPRLREADVGLLPAEAVERWHLAYVGPGVGRECGRLHQSAAFGASAWRGARGDGGYAVADE